jgi:hypothetical protein
MANQTTHITRRNQDIEAADIDLSGNLSVDGTSTLTGAITAPGGITGDIVGDVTGNTVGEHRHSTQELTASGAITLNSGLFTLNHASVIIAATLDAPVAGDELYIVNNSASGTAAHTVTTAAGVTWDGTNNTATLNAPGEALHVIALSATRWFILENIGAVALSAV